MNRISNSLLSYIKNNTLKDRYTIINSIDNIQKNNTYVAYIDNLSDPDVSKRFKNAEEALSFLKKPLNTKIAEKVRIIKSKENKVFDSEWEQFKYGFINDIIRGERWNLLKEQK